MGATSGVGDAIGEAMLVENCELADWLCGMTIQAVELVLFSNLVGWPGRTRSSAEGSALRDIDVLESCHVGIEYGCER